MKKYLQKKLNNEKGMTLIELLAVIVIIAIIAAIAIPAISGVIENSRVGAIKSDAINIISAAELLNADNVIDTATEGVVTVGELKTKGFLDDAGTFDTVSGASVNLATKEFTGTSVAINGVSIDFTGATKTKISAVANSSDAGETGVVITRPE